MKLKSFLVGLLIASTNAFAAQTPIPDQQQTVKNYLVNPGFENGTYGWTASGGATKTANTTAKGEGNYGYEWDSNSSSQTLVSNSITIPAGLYGKNGLAYCKFKVPSGTATHTITVNDGSSDLVTAQTISTSSSQFAIQAVSFVFPGSGTIRFKTTSVDSNEPSVYIDSCYLGENYLIGVNTHKSVGDVFSTASSACPAGSMSADGTAVSRTTYSTLFANIGTTFGVGNGSTTFNVPDTSGIFLSGAGSKTISGIVHTRTLGTTQNDQFQGHAHSTSSPLTAFLGPGASTAGGSGTSFGQAIATGAANANDGTNGSPRAGTTTYPANVAVKYCIQFQGGETTYFPELINWRVDANIAGANVDLSAVDQSSYVGITDAGLTLTNNTGKGVLTAQVPCSSTNAPSGTTCSAGNESIGVSFTLPAAGDVLACASFGHHVNNTAGTAVKATFQIVETPANAQTISQEGKSRVASHFETASTNSTHPMRVCGTFTFSSAGQKVLRLFYEQDLSSVPTSNRIVADADAALGQRDIHWEVYPISQAMPAPILVGSVTSNSTGTERIERARLTVDTSASIISQSGSWLTAATGNATGNASFTIASGIFSATPTCTCTATVDVSGNSNAYICNQDTRSGAWTSTSMRWQFRQASTNGAVSGVIDVVCMGPK